MKVNMFNHWFKHKVPIDNHFESIKDAITKNQSNYRRLLSLWEWLDKEYDVGQYYKVSESRNYLVFHNEQHYITFLLKL